MVPGEVRDGHEQRHVASVVALSPRFTVLDDLFVYSLSAIIMSSYRGSH